MAGYLKAHNGSWAVALACYNAGSGATATALTYGANWLAHLPLRLRTILPPFLGMEVRHEEAFKTVDGSVLCSNVAYPGLAGRVGDQLFTSI